MNDLIYLALALAGVLFIIWLMVKAGEWGNKLADYQHRIECAEDWYRAL